MEWSVEFLGQQEVQKRQWGLTKWGANLHPLTVVKDTLALQIGSIEILDTVAMIMNDVIHT